MEVLASASVSTAANPTGMTLHVLFTKRDCLDVEYRTRE